jgi:23S rRNA (adenine2503-C2)-methyltransferase
LKSESEKKRASVIRREQREEAASIQDTLPAGESLPFAALAGGMVD